ncbi:hypothetical protein K458DRAFT_417406 [Lentithecium fluviatile CBS 122367]|uniref:Uncharacterized protein n=1 Tax=Lentithecium fluviatile CBS 122367 TaxID=1168545 RepID=A0A6G1J487_9PLEO|nr:hypothetical protein K458DRAFT_417406 [Lentithecium fluviatile CBS 122367]
MERSAEEARSKFGTDAETSNNYDCFFKVVDVLAGGREFEDRGQCFHSEQLESYYKAVPPQPANAIRLVLDGRLRRVWLPRDGVDGNSGSPSYCGSLISSNHIEYTPRPCPLYSSPAVINDSFRYYHLPTLRKIMEMDGERRWYGMNCFASHIEECPIRSKMIHVPQSTFERSDAYITVCKDNEGLLKVVCYAPNAFAAPLDSDPRGYKCANANWRFLNQVDTSLTGSGPSYLASDSEMQTLRLLLMDLIAVNLEQTANFLDYISSRTDDEDWRILPRDFLPFLETRLVDTLSERILVLRTVEDAMANISGAIERIAGSVRTIHPDQATTFGVSSDIASHLDGLQQDCIYYKNWATQLRTRSTEIHNVMVSRFNVKQASSVNQLTLLAALFLPLSLAAGVLSMQTRFADLHLLLFDFVGVVVILATLAMLFAIVSRYGKEVGKLMLLGPGSGRGRYHHLAFRYMRVGVLSLWWLAISSSFLVGMIKDVVFGLKVFGFEAAGIVVFWWVSYGLFGWMEKLRLLA